MRIVSNHIYQIHFMLVLKFPDKKIVEKVTLIIALSQAPSAPVCSEPIAPSRENNLGAASTHSNNATHELAQVLTTTSLSRSQRVASAIALPASQFLTGLLLVSLSKL
jgi:hypothetical protein